MLEQKVDCALRVSSEWVRAPVSERGINFHTLYTFNFQPLILVLDFFVLFWQTFLMIPTTGEIVRKVLKVFKIFFCLLLYVTCTVL